VTGAAGFFGGRFAAACLERGTLVVAVDRADQFRARPELAAIPFQQIVDRDELIAWLDATRPALSGIVHLGACTDTTASDSAYLARVNTDYSKALWRHAGGESLPFVYASSAATYGDGSRGNDDDEAGIAKLAPLNPYAESKQRFDLFALAEEARGAAPPSWSGFKLFNVYGYGERHKQKMSSVVLQSFDQIRDRGGVRLFRSHRPGIADGHQSRDFVYVTDVVTVLHFALTHPLRRGIYNLGTGRARSFLELAHAAFAALGRPPRIEFVDMPESLRPQYQYFTEARMEKLRAAGYAEPFTSLEAGVRDYVERLAKDVPPPRRPAA
jgi:ADP-L-glycero-D-manno-heptose 6-epimerase